MQRWNIPAVCPDSFVKATPNLHWVIRQYMWNRGITDPDYIDAFMAGDVLHDTNPHLMKDMVKGNERVWQAINDGSRIVIYGDYDADGVTATSALYLALKTLGANVEWFVPHRKVGYGMRPKPVEELRAIYPDCNLIVTVDNGIKATKAITRANELGFDVVVTDHHSVDYSDFPSDAYAVINPQQDDCSYYEANLAGAGVAYKFIHGMALYGLQQGYDLPVANEDEALAFADRWVDIVALGTIGDMMPLAALENRQIVMKGMDKMARNPAQGIRQLATSHARRYEVDLVESTSVDLAFNIVPFINAASRMGDPKWAVELLVAENAMQAAPKARKLVELNTIRKEQQQERMMQVMEALQGQDTSFEAMPMLIVQVPDCPKGLIGLVAGSLNHEFGRPSAVLADTGNGIWTASARSVAGMNIAHALRECDDLLVSHGGHSMAAGFGIKEDNIPEFIERMQAIALRDLSRDYDKPEMPVDIELPLAYVDWNLFDAISALEPHSSVDLMPIRFVTRNVEPVDAKRWSQSKKHLQMEVYDKKGNLVKANGWGFGTWADNMPRMIDIVYALESTEWGGQNNGKPYLRLAIEAIQPSESVLAEQGIDPDEVRHLLSSKKNNRVS